MLGDLVGSGPHPQACVDRVRGLADAAVVRGNHDHLAAAAGPAPDLNRVARAALEWTRGRLPAEVWCPPWLAVHGAPHCPDRFTACVYELTDRDNLTRLVETGVGACFYGHTHVPFIHRRTAAGDEKLTPGPVRLFRPARPSWSTPGRSASRGTATRDRRSYCGTGGPTGCRSTGPSTRSTRRPPPCWRPGCPKTWPGGGDRPPT